MSRMLPRGAASWTRGLAALLFATGLASAAAAELRGSPDVHVDRSAGLIGPGDVSEDVGSASAGLVDLGPLPAGTDVGAHAVFGPDALFSVKHAVSLPGGVVAQRQDVVSWDGSVYALALDGQGSGIPASAAIDALAFDAQSGALWLSFDVAVEIGGQLVREADVVDAASLALVFDSAAAGVPAGANLDAVSMDPGSSDVLLSFDVGGMLGGITYADEDVLRYEPGGGSWSLELDASAVEASWGAADLDAVQLPEPGGLGASMAACALLALLFQRRRGSRPPA